MMVRVLVYGSYIHTGGKSGGELLTLFDSYSYNGVSAGIWVIHNCGKSWGEKVTLFDSFCHDGVNVVLGVAILLCK